MTKLWKWLKSICKCTKRCKCLHCRFGRWLKKKGSNLKVWVLYQAQEGGRLKGAGLIASSLLLWLTGSFECTAAFLLLGWGLLELLEYWHWK
tara:strand:+ start:1233 stop:1508 length:276 start_codon:yes stop_codon:yes gene_type:complete